MDYFSITEQYYSCWIGCGQLTCKPAAGTHLNFVYSPQRNQVPPGYNKPFDWYILYQPGHILVSYGDKLHPHLKALQSALRPYLTPDVLSDFPSSENCPTAALTAAALEQAVCRALDGAAYLARNIKYVFTGLPQFAPARRARALCAQEFPLYHDFFLRCHPLCKDTDWLETYFLQAVNQKLCWGIFDEGQLVCCSDVPTMPYLADKVQEIGIQTLVGYQRRGYALDVCLACAEQILRLEKCPMWSTSADNIASQRLAKRVGFAPYAQVITVTAASA